MKNKLFFRVIGALFSSLIIISVFMPFTKLDTQSLWDMYHSSNMIYLPIMIIVFGSIGVLFFSLNVKTEFAYATSGAIIFFTVVQLVQAINYNTVESLGLGFYFLAIGGLVTGLMAFLSNLKGKKEKKETLTQMPAMNVISVPVQNDALPQNFNNVNSQYISSVSSLADTVTPQVPVPEINNVTSQVPVPEINNVTPQVPVPEINNVAPQVPVPEINNVTPQVPVPEINNVTPQVPVPEINNVIPQVPVPEMSNTNNSLNENVQNIAINPIPKDTLVGQQNSNPVVSQFIQTNSDTSDISNTVSLNNPVTVNSNNTNQNSNMQDLDIFGNFQ